MDVSLVSYQTVRRVKFFLCINDELQMGEKKKVVYFAVEGGWCWGDLGCSVCL